MEQQCDSFAVRNHSAMRNAHHEMLKFLRSLHPASFSHVVTSPSPFPKSMLVLWRITLNEKKKRNLRSFVLMIQKSWKSDDDAYPTPPIIIYSKTTTYNIGHYWVWVLSFCELRQSQLRIVDIRFLQIKAYKCMRHSKLTKLFEFWTTHQGVWQTQNK